MGGGIETAGIEHLRVMRPLAQLVAFYDGRVPGYRFSERPNWVDDGALALGICTYALVDGPDAVVFDTHVSPEHGARIRATLAELGARRFVVVLSHWHLDHVAGTGAFGDCEVVASRLTAERLTRDRTAIEHGRLEGPPGISPLVLPTTLVDERHSFACGGLTIELIRFAIHSADGMALHVPELDLLLAGDMLEDTVTYVSEADALETDLVELERLRGLGSRIFPDHGSPERIAAGGYDMTLIDATSRYLRDLLLACDEPTRRERDLRSFVADQLAAGWLDYFEPYERVHRENVKAVLDARSRLTTARPGLATDLG